MQLRCDINLDGVNKKLILVTQEQETPQHLALKLAGYLLFFDQNPIVDLSMKHPALNQQEFRPDLVALNEAGEIKLWVECGTVTSHKMDKISRRWREARIVALKETLREAENLRRMLGKNEVSQSERIEILAFPGDSFKEWAGALENVTDIVGEHNGRSFNLVVNAVPLSFDFVSA